jgi:hypothetical protein
MDQNKRISVSSRQFKSDENSSIVANEDPLKRSQLYRLTGKHMGSQPSLQVKGLVRCGTS